MNRANFSVQLYDLEEGKPYTKGKCRIFYTGKNRNQTHISQECADYMASNIAYTPVIGEWSEDIENFKGHGGKVIIDSDGIEYIDTTKPYGCAMDEPVWYESVEEENGEIHNYMCCNVALWDKRYPELKKVLEDGSHQSMEIELIDGEFKDGIYYISKANFLGLCILGKDEENPDNDTEPCFQQASIESLNTTEGNVAYSLKKDKFMGEFNDMLKEMKLIPQQNQSSTGVDIINDRSNFSVINKEGGNENLNERMELLAKYNLTVEQLDFNIEELSLDELEVKLEEFSASLNDDSTEGATEPLVVEFSATYRQKYEAINNALEPKTERDADDNIVYEEYFWLSDFDDTYAYVEKTIWNPDYESKCGRCSYTFDAETMTASVTSEFEEMILTWMTLEENQKLQDERNTMASDFEALTQEFNEYKNKYSVENEEVSRLQAFEKTTLTEIREESEKALFEQFRELDGIEAYELLKTNKADFELEDLEKECFVILGMKNANFSYKQNNKTKVKVSKSKVETKNDDADKNAFEEEFGAYLNRK